jgi:hypothetical protein
MITEIFLLATALIFTGVGWWFGKQNGIELASEATIDYLIENNYLRHKMKDEEIELIKWNDHTQN